MPATNTSLVIEQGTSWARAWAVTVNDAPIDETWTAKSQVRARATASSPLLHEFTAAVDENGIVKISVTPVESSAWTWTQAIYDVEATSSDGLTVVRVAEGSVTVSPEVTR